MAIGTVGAIIGGSLIGGAASIYSGKKAAGAQSDAANVATAEQRRQFDLSRADQLAQLAQQRKDQEPWMTAGRNSLAQIMSGMGQGGEFMQTFGADDFQTDPGYQFRMSEGQRGLDNSFAARGGLLSGAAMKAAMRFNQGEASQEFGNAYNRFNNDRSTKFNRLASLAGVGQSATNTVGQAGQNTTNALSQLGQNYANNVGQNIMGAGNARASAYMNTGNAINNGLSNLTGLYMQNQMLKGMGG